MGYFTPHLHAKNVSSAGTAVALTSAGNPVRSGVIQAKANNQGNIYLGDSTVTNGASTNGIVLTPGASFSIGNDGNDSKLDLSTWFINADTNNDGVNIIEF